MSAIPQIPPSVRTLEQLDLWIEREASRCNGLADRLRMAAAVMDRASRIGEIARGAAEPAPKLL